MAPNPDAARGPWLVRSEKALYSDPWLDIRVADVELPDGRHLEHRLIRTPPAAGAVVTDQHRRVLLLWRHRFITGTWGWEIPIGQVDLGEDVAAAAAREVEEETGWRPGPLTPLLRVEPTAGISTSVHHLYRARSATRIGDPEDGFESSRIEWVPMDAIPRLIDAGEISSGTTLAALLYTLEPGDRTSRTSDLGGRVAAGGTALDPEVISQLLGASRRTGRLGSLSPRERGVLALMAEGRPPPGAVAHPG